MADERTGPIGDLARFRKYLEIGRSSCLLGHIIADLKQHLGISVVARDAF
jgi:hypothetical protein